MGRRSAGTVTVYPPGAAAAGSRASARGKARPRGGSLRRPPPSSCAAGCRLRRSPRRRRLRLGPGWAGESRRERCGSARRPPARRVRLSARWCAAARRDVERRRPAQARIGRARPVAGDGRVGGDSDALQAASCAQWAQVLDQLVAQVSQQARRRLVAPSSASRQGRDRPASRRAEHAHALAALALPDELGVRLGYTMPHIRVE